MAKSQKHSDPVRITKLILKPGRVMCLGPCGKMFDSPDRVGHRFCPHCRTRRDNSKLGDFSISVSRFLERQKAYSNEAKADEEDVNEFIKHYTEGVLT